MSPTGRPATLPTQGYRSPQRVFSTPTACTVVFYAERDGRRWEFDLSDLPVSRELRDWMAHAFAGITGPAGRRRTKSSAYGVHRALREFARFLSTLKRPPTKPSQLRPSHLDGLLLSHERKGRRRDLHTLRSTLRYAQDVPAGLAARLNEVRGEDVDGKTTSYTESEFRRILAAARAQLRTSAARIRAGRALLARWRAGEVDADRPAWELGWLLDHADRTDDVPRYGGATRPPHAWVGQHGGVAPLFAQLYLTYSDIAAAAVLLLGVTGQNLSTLSEISATHHRPDGDAGSTRTALVEMVKPRRGRHRAHMTVPLQDVPLDDDADGETGSVEPAPVIGEPHVGLRSPFEIYELIRELTEPARRRTGSDNLLIHSSRAGQRGIARFRTGLGKSQITDWSKYANLVSDTLDETGTPTPLRIDSRRIRMTWLELHQQPVAHTEQTLANDYLARNRGNLTEYQEIVATTLDEQVAAARSTALMRTLTAEQVERARLDPAAVAAEQGLATNVLTNLLAGKLDTVLGGCIDNTHSPHAPAGQPCRASFLLCLSCPCARATPAHLPLLIGVFDTLQQRASEMTPLRFAQRFAAPVAQLADLLSRFPAESVNIARAEITPDQQALVQRFLARGLDLT